MHHPQPLIAPKPTATMTSTPSPATRVLLFLFLFSISATTGLAKVPASETFQYVNEGEYGMYISEYDASYRSTPLFASPFQLMWYNTTPGHYYIGLRMGLRRTESQLRWVWEANRGRPVGENATLTFGADGNLVLAEADGRVAWSTGTVGKGVVGLKLLPVGNIVLHDKAGRFVWQSFDHPTDTLLVGQSLRLGGPTKLVSRRSETENSDGMYSFVLEPRGLALYVDASPKPLPYYKNTEPGGMFSFSAPVTNVTFEATPETEDNSAWDLTLGGHILARPKYNATLSMLRLQLDGNLVVFTYYHPVGYMSWERTFAFFSDRGGAYGFNGCDLPSKCGSLGVCADEMCVACPTPKGLVGWSKSCSSRAASKPGACRPGASANYYKVVGVENFVTRFAGGVGPTKVGDCKKRCSMDCNCRGFFYWEESSKCWLAPVLGTLSSVSNSSHVAYIKSS